MNNLEKIRQACIKANPEIMELKFGCRFLDGKKETEHLIFRAEEGEEMLETLAMTDWFGVMELKTHNIGREYVEGKKPELGVPIILGREIQLADVLLARNYRAHEQLQEGKIPPPQDSTTIKICIRWDMKLPLSGQGVETIDFIVNLLNI